MIDEYVKIRFLIFKLKHDIANDSELPLARMEVEALTRSSAVEIPNLSDLLFDLAEVFRTLTTPNRFQRIQDVLLRMPYPGKYQALLVSDSYIDLSVLKRRLTYCRDFFAVCSTPEL